MMIKKFVAPTMKEAVVKMKKELGEDAVVLKTAKTSNGGMLDFAGKSGVEITAAVDQGTGSAAAPAKTQSTRPATPVQHRQTKAQSQKDDYRNVVLRTEINDLKNNLAQVSSFLKYQNVPSLPENLQIIMKQLLDNEVEEHYARQVVEEIHNELSGNDYKDLKFIVALLLKKIAIKIRPRNYKAPIKTGKPVVAMMIGPTGVGKTTTIAKLATNQKLINKKKVALISADTFRIGAVDQLKTFANIADIPLTVAYTPNDVKAAIQSYSDMDIIYIDTTGRSQRDNDRLKDMKKFVDESNPDETHLVLSVTTRLKDIREAIDKFSIFNYTKLLFTKIDETSSLGVLMNVLHDTKTPVSYLTNGQNVPEDIERATLEKMAKMIVRRKAN